MDYQQEVELIKKMQDTMARPEHVSELCFTLGLSQSVLVGSHSVKEQLWEIFQYYKRRNELPTLIAGLEKMRPFHEWQLAEPEPSTPTLTFQQKQKLVAVLLACPAMTQKREQIVAELPIEAKQILIRAREDREDVLAILNASLTTPQTFQMFIEILGFFAGEQTASFQQVKWVAQEYGLVVS